MVTDGDEELGAMEEEEDDMLDALAMAIVEDKSSVEPLRLSLGTVLVAV